LQIESCSLLPVAAATVEHKQLSKSSTTWHGVIALEQACAAVNAKLPCCLPSTLDVDDMTELLLPLVVVLLLLQFVC
jgi:hypothetical protein